jgi:dGTPase
VEAADDIVNRLVDVEDAIKLKLITYAEVCDVLRAVDEPVAKELLEKTEVHREAIKTGTAAEQQLWAYQNFRVRATTKLAQACEVVFCDAVEQLETGGFEGDLISNCEHAALYEAIKKLEYEKIFGDAEIVRIEAGGKKAIGGLLEMFAEELSNKSKLSKTMPMPMTSDMDTENDSHASIARVVDYVAGMTDRYAIDLYQELSGVSL